MDQENKEKTPFVGARKIFIVEDEEQVASFLIGILRRHGFEAWSERDPRKALARARELRPDLLILDFSMPSLLGPELASVLKQDPETFGIPIVFLSGMADEDHRVIGSASGGVAYLGKPVDEGLLLATITQVLGER